MPANVDAYVIGNGGAYTVTNVSYIDEANNPVVIDFEAAELIETLSQPANSNWRMSSRVLIPPPTVSGMNTCSAVRRTTSSMASKVMRSPSLYPNENATAALAVATAEEVAAFLEETFYRMNEYLANFDINYHAFESYKILSIIKIVS